MSDQTTQYTPQPGWQPPAPEKKPNWFARHKILTALIGGGHILMEDIYWHTHRRMRELQPG